MLKLLTAWALPLLAALASRLILRVARRSVTIRGCVEAAPSCASNALPILKARRADIGQRTPQVALEQGDARVRGGVHAARQGSLRRGPTEPFQRGCFVNVHCDLNRRA